MCLNSLDSAHGSLILPDPERIFSDIGYRGAACGKLRRFPNPDCRPSSGCSPPSGATLRYVFGFVPVTASNGFRRQPIKTWTSYASLAQRRLRRGESVDIIRLPFDTGGSLLSLKSAKLSPVAFPARPSRKLWAARHWPRRTETTGGVTLLGSMLGPAVR